MSIELKNLKPSYMSELEISDSDIYLSKSLFLEVGKKYLVKANSGHGKSSLLNFIYGSNTSFDGIINYNKFNGKNLFDYRRTEISYVFQDLRLFKGLTVFENIQLKNCLTNHKTEDEIYDMIDKVQLSHKKNSLVDKMSLGQKQRVAIIRSLCQPFKFLLLDEPFSHLDNKNISIITKLVSSEIDKQHASLIMTSLVDTKSFAFDKILSL